MITEEKNLIPTGWLQVTEGTTTTSDKYWDSRGWWLPCAGGAPVTDYAAVIRRNGD